MRQSHSPEPAAPRRRPGHHASATTADGVAAERVAVADRERRRARAIAAARRLEERPARR